MSSVTDAIFLALSSVFEIWDILFVAFDSLSLITSLFFFFVFYRFILRPILGGNFFGVKSVGSDMVRSRSSDKADNKRK